MGMAFSNTIPNMYILYVYRYIYIYTIYYILYTVYIVFISCIYTVYRYRWHRYARSVSHWGPWIGIINPWEQGWKHRHLSCLTVIVIDRIALKGIGDYHDRTGNLNRKKPKNGERIRISSSEKPQQYVFIQLFNRKTSQKKICRCATLPGPRDRCHQHQWGAAVWRFHQRT